MTFLSALEREAVQVWPRQYVSDELETHERKAVTHEASKTLALALARQHGKFLNSSHVAAAVNATLPGNCCVVNRESFEEMRDYAIALYRFAKAAEDIAEGNHEQIVDKLIDLVRDSHRFTLDFWRAMLNMPDVIANNS